MKKYEKAPADVAATTEAVMEEKGGTFNHHQENTIETGRISRFLMHGQDNSISTADLLRLTGYEHIREVRQAIEHERKEGTPILTCKGNRGGYFLPSEEPAIAIAELRAFIRLQTGKGLGCLRSMKPAKKLLAELQRKAYGQQEMEL